MDGGALPISELEDASESTRAKLGLRAKLVRVYALQVLLISVAACAAPAKKIVVVAAPARVLRVPMHHSKS